MNALSLLVSSFLHDHLSLLGNLGLCVAVAYFFMRGLLGVSYEVANWVFKKLDGLDDEKEP